MPKTEREEPRRWKVRNERQDPMWELSRMEIMLAILTNPKTESDDPTRAKLLKLVALPIDA
jgi:hypothetical protein